MPRKASVSAPQLVEVPPTDESQSISPQLEEPTPQIKALVGGAVSVVDNAARQLETAAPGWSYYLRQFVEVTDGVMSTAP